MEADMSERCVVKWHGVEPSIEEIFADPIVLALMRSDGIDSADAWNAMRGNQTEQPRLARGIRGKRERNLS
jgi:hypothetical protein